MRERVDREGTFRGAIGMTLVAKLLKKNLQRRSEIIRGNRTGEAGNQRAQESSAEPQLKTDRSGKLTAPSHRSISTHGSAELQEQLSDDTNAVSAGRP
jgi:hypothetical protein